MVKSRGGVDKEKTELTPYNLVHLVDCGFGYRLIIQPIKQNVQSSFRIIHDPLDRGLGISAYSL
jgi:hypothetical protein